MRWACGCLIPAGFFVACNVWEAEASLLFDGSVHFSHDIKSIVCLVKFTHFRKHLDREAFTLKACLKIKHGHSGGPPGPTKPSLAGLNLLRKVAFLPVNMKIKLLSGVRFLQVRHDC